YTPARLGDARTRGVVVKTYMAHHQAMSLVALDNCLHGNPMERRFHAEPRVQAAELLLQERSPHLVPLDTPPDEHKVAETSGRSRQTAPCCAGATPTSSCIPRSPCRPRTMRKFAACR